jgi:phenylalanyl-tRNA synthetase beta chain
MRISFNWLKEYLEITEPAERLSQVLTSLGLEVESMETHEDIKGGLKGVVVAEVVECWKHPNADRLNLTKVNTGEGELLQVVCGAPNVAVGQKVFLAKEGATLYPFAGNPITIKKGKIRGETSEGMICAEDELGLSANHEGILILPTDAEVGKPAADVLNISSDIIFEIGLTPNRADAMSHLGVAKDLLAWSRVHKNRSKSLKQLELADIKNASGNLKINVEVSDPDLCPRYSGICLSGITVSESPDWLKKRIRSMGLNPINNIVDVTNFIMYEMGQPLHAFDYDQIQKQSIHVKTLKEGTSFKSLDEADRKLFASDLMICDGNDNPLCIAGVFGGIGSGVTEKTTKIFIESAHFNAGSVRKSSMSHNLRTQSARCFEKGTDPNATLLALQRAVYLIQQTCAAKIDSILIDVYPKEIKPSQVDLNLDYVRQLSGLPIDKEKIKEVLFALDMEVTDLQNDNFEVFVPTNKPDVKRPADVVEEICRVYGFDQIIVPEKIQISFPKHIPSTYFIRKEISEWLTSNGLNEIMAISLVKSGICIQSGIWNEKDLVFIHNTSNVHLDAMRPSICLGGLEAIQFNANRQQTDLAFYEMGKEYQRQADRIVEKNKLGIWLYGLQTSPHWLNPKPTMQDFTNLKSYIEGILKMLKIENQIVSDLQDDSLFNSGIQYSFFKNNNVGIKAGKLSSTLSSLYDLKKEVWFAEFDLDILMQAIPVKAKPFKEFSKFPQIKRDLALVIDQQIKFETLKSIAVKQTGDLLRDIQLFDIYENADQLGVGKKSYALSFTFENVERQLSSEEMESLMNGLIKIYEKEVGAIVRK